MSKLSIAIDMGAKNNGIFICKSDGTNILDKKALCVSIDGRNINFSKKSRRENRHKDRNYKRRNLARRLFKELIDLENYSQKNQETLLGLLKNRGYTFLSTEVEFEKLDDKTLDFFKKNYPNYRDLKTKENYEVYLGSEFEKKSEILEFLEEELKDLNIEIKRKKEEFDSDFKDSVKPIKDDLKILKDFLENIKKEIETGSKPRKQYLKEIKSEIEGLEFIKEKESFCNLVGNISNLQLRVLRKFFNYNSQHKERFEILKSYFKAHHYKKPDEKQRRIELFKELKKHQDLKMFLEDCEPELTIPPYEDMNNRDTYKCNSMLIKPEEITEEIKEAIDRVLANDNFSTLLATEEIFSGGEFKKEKSVRVKPSKGDKYLETDYTYSIYLQRILDATKEVTTKELNPRNVFKHQAFFERGTVSSVEHFKKVLGEDVYKTLKTIAEDYYKEEMKILNGIYEKETSILEKCNTNTPYKNNLKHTLLKPLYGYNFSETEAEMFLEKLKDTRGIKTFLERVSKQAKRNQNGFYSLVLSCYESKKCVSDKEIKYIVDNFEKNLSAIQGVLKDLKFDSASFLKVEKLDEKNLTNALNIFKQTYEILFKDLKGFNKTCKHCTKENAIRSNIDLVIGKRLLSDVAKPIDGMLDMMLDRLSFEISKEIEAQDLEEVTTLEILLEQNKFEFEENLNDIKRKNDSTIKKFDPNSFNEPLNAKVCPYTGESINHGDYDHILPQSDGVYNSKANLIYASVKGNREKGARKYTLEMLNEKHLKEIFKTDNKDEIKKFIKENLAKIDEKNFKNFDRLKFKEQIALRYALFLRGTEEFTKAFNLVKKDKLKTISNGTQKRLARLLYEKLAKKFPQKFRSLDVDSKVLDNKLVSASRRALSVNPITGEVAETRRELSYNHETGEVMPNTSKDDTVIEVKVDGKKTKVQTPFSHIIDAMVVYHIANKNSFEEFHAIKGKFAHDGEYTSTVRTKYWSETDNPKYKIESKRIFDENDIGVGYLQLQKKTTTNDKGKEKIKFQKWIVFDSFVDTSFTKANFEYFKNNEILEEKIIKKNKTIYTVYVVNKNKLYKKLFDEKQEVLESNNKGKDKNLGHYNKLDAELRYTYTSVSPFDFTDKFLDPNGNDKAAVKKIIQKERPSFDDITAQNLMAWYSRSNKLDKNGAKLGYLKSWEIFADILEKNKNKLFSETIKNKGEKNEYKYFKLSHEKALELCKKTLFKQTHRKRRDKKKNAYTLYSASKKDTQYVHRRQIDTDENKEPIYIYQTRTAHRDNPVKKPISEDGKVFFKKMKNIIPLQMKNYELAFKKENHMKDLIVYNNGELELKISVESETIWLTQKQLGELFNVEVNTVNYHIKKIFKEKELEKNATIRKIRIVQKEGNREVEREVEHYNLDMVISVGYRVNSLTATKFRQWATKVLKSYITDGYAINTHKITEQRLTSLEKDMKSVKDLLQTNSLELKQGVFFQGEVFDAYSLLATLIKKAKNSIIVIDNYIDESILTLLSKNQKIEVTLFTPIVSKELKLDIEKYNKQYNNLEVKIVKNFHDRFLIVDKMEVFHIGASLKDLGKKVFAFSKLEIDSNLLLKDL